MISIGSIWPEFELTGVVSPKVENAFQPVKSSDYKNKWLVAFFWPKDFTFVCPTEIAEFGRLNNEFKQRDAEIIGVSTDSEFVHLAWKQAKPELLDLPFPMLSDIKRELSSALGIIDPVEGVAQRATFIIDPQHIVRFVMVNDLNVGRNPEEVLRVLDALQSGSLCPCKWEAGQDTLQVDEPLKRAKL